MIRIDRLKIQLPANLRPHAQSIITEIARRLAETNAPTAGRIDRVSVPPVKALPGQSHRVIAARAAEAVRKQIDAGNAQRQAGERS